MSTQDVRESILAKFEGTVEECELLAAWVRDASKAHRTAEQELQEWASEERRQLEIARSEVDLLLDGYRVDSAIRAFLRDRDDWAKHELCHRLRSSGLTTADVAAIHGYMQEEAEAEA